MATLIVSICMLLALISIHADTAFATKACYQCRGINCQRLNYNNMETCTNELDVCVTIFKGPMVQAQGCFEQISEDLRVICTAQNELETDEGHYCHMCNENACNTLGASDFKCIQCDSQTNDMCRKNPEALEPLRCPLARTINSYCYTHEKDDRVERGCTITAKDVRDCSRNENCIVCSPFDLRGCNNVPFKESTNPDTNGNQSRASHTNITLSLVVMQLLILSFKTILSNY